MAIKFGQLEGKAKKSSINQFTYRDGDNVVRMVGDILPRYVYWIKGENAKNIPSEGCLFLFKINGLGISVVGRYG